MQTSLLCKRSSQTNAMVLFGSKINKSLELLQKLGVLLPILQKKKIYFLCPYPHPVHFKIILLIDGINSSAVSNLIDAARFQCRKYNPLQ